MDCAEQAPAFDASVTIKLADWVSGLSLDQVPEEVRELAGSCVLDALGCGLYGAAQPWGQIAADVAFDFSPKGPSSLLGRSAKVSPSDAAMANGTAIHGFELDDLHAAASCHPGAVTIPASLAIGEARRISGKTFLTSLVAGYEAGIRVGVCAGLTHSSSGYHGTGTVGTICSSAAAARAMGLDAERTTHALGIGATQAGGLYSARKGAMSKRFHAGRAAQSGVVAASLAERGFTGSTEVLEATFGGFMSTLRGQFPPATILDELGERWRMLDIGFKAYASCGSTHTMIAALDQMMQHGLSVDNVEDITVHMTQKAMTNVAWPYQPNGIAAAQMNGYFAAAVMLLDGEVFIDQYREERLADPQILALIKRIKFVNDPVLDEAGAAKRHTVRVEARMSNGREMSATIAKRRGSTENPLSKGEIEKKFRRLAAACLTTAAIDEIIQIVPALEKEPDLTRLTSLLAPAAATYSHTIRGALQAQD
jgi:2-methylcitrate dehydratase PrpD